MGRIFNAEEENTWSTQAEEISGLIAEKLEAMVETNNPDFGLILSKSKAIWALLPHTVSWRRLRWGMILTRAVYHPSRVLLPSRYVEPFVDTLLNKSSSHFLSRAALLASPYIPASSGFWNNSRVSRWNAIALNVLKGAGEDAIGMDTVGERAVSDIEVGESVADMLLRFARKETLRRQIPAETWVWLKKPRSLPILSPWRWLWTTDDAVCHIRGLGDIEILKSYFLLVWSERDHPEDGGLREMEISIRDDFSGVERWHDREELIERLDQVLGQLSLGPAHLEQHLPPWIFVHYNIQRAVSQYSSLKNALLEVHESVLLRTSLRVSLLKKYTDSLEHLQDLT